MGKKLNYSKLAIDSLMLSVLLVAMLIPVGMIAGILNLPLALINIPLSIEAVITVFLGLFVANAVKEMFL